MYGVLEHAYKKYLSNVVSPLNHLHDHSTAKFVHSTQSKTALPWYSSVRYSNGKLALHTHKALYSSLAGDLCYCETAIMRRLDDGVQLRKGISATSNQHGIQTLTLFASRYMSLLHFS